jgi:hypothetical protein
MGSRLQLVSSTQVRGLPDDLQLWIVNVVQLLRSLVFFYEVRRESATTLGCNQIG